MGFELLELNEPVEVLTHFDAGRVRPLRFRWRGRIYRVEKVNGTWSRAKGGEREHHFAITADNEDSFELVFDTTDFRWRVTRVMLAT